MLKFAKTKVEADIYGTVYKLRRPTVQESQAYAKVAQKADEEETTKELLKLLAECGLPEEIAESMEADHLIQLIEALMPKKNG